MNNEQNRVLGRLLADELSPEALVDASAAGGTLPNLDSGSGTSIYTAGPTPQTSDIRINRDWPTA